jgi:hypothetical protein
VTSRPLPLLLAIVVLAVEGVGAIAFAVLIATVKGAVIGEVVWYVDLLAATAVAFGAPALVAMVGAWARRSWSWLVGVIVQSILLLGVAAAIVSGGWHPALVIAVALAGAGLAGLLAPVTRRVLGV